jgi:hypothetical protein
MHCLTCATELPAVARFCPSCGQPVGPARRAETVNATVWTIFMISPMTLDMSAWYAGAGLTMFFYVAAIALYGFRTAIGGRPGLT